MFTRGTTLMTSCLLDTGKRKSDCSYPIWKNDGKWRFIYDPLITVSVLPKTEHDVL